MGLVGTFLLPLDWVFYLLLGTMVASIFFIIAVGKMKKKKKRENWLQIFLYETRWEMRMFKDLIKIGTSKDNLFGYLEGNWYTLHEQLHWIDNVVLCVVHLHSS